MRRDDLCGCVARRVQRGHRQPHPAPGEAVGIAERVENGVFAQHAVLAFGALIERETARDGINMDAVKLAADTIKHTAAITPEGFGCAKIVVFCNAVEDNPFMAGAFHGAGEADAVINVGVSGPGVVQAALQHCDGKNLTEIAEVVKKTAFKITRVGELIGQEAARRFGIPFGILDLSLAPTPAVGDSVARILEAMGLSVCGTHGTTAALALLNDAVKKGGMMAR